MKVLKWLEKNFELTILLAMLVAISTLMFANVILRYCFHSSIVWADEVCRYCFIITGFVGLGYCLRHNKLIRMESVKQMLPYKGQCLLDAFVDLLLAVYFVYFFINSYSIIQKAVVGKMVSPILYFPMSIMYGISVYGYLLAAIRAIQKGYKDVKSAVGGKKEGAEK